MFYLKTIKNKLNLALLIISMLSLLSIPLTLLASKKCESNGAWLQVLGSGGPEVIQSGRVSSSYLIWLDGKARLLVDTGGGSAINFAKSGADFKNLDAIVFTHLHVDHSVDLPIFIKASYFGERSRDLPIFGPTGNKLMPSMQAFINALFDEPKGAFHYLSDFVDPAQSSAYKLIAHDISAHDKTLWSGFKSKHLQLSAIPVHHGPIPALAWRIDIDGHSITFSGDMNGDNETLKKLAIGSDILLAHNAIPENATGGARQLHMPPSIIGSIAARAKVKQLVLSHRMRRTLGTEQQTLHNIQHHYQGPVAFAEDMDCFQL